MDILRREPAPPLPAAGEKRASVSGSPQQPESKRAMHDTLCALCLEAVPGTVIIDGGREMLEVHVERIRAPEKERQAVERLGMPPCSEVLLIGAVRNREVRMQNRSHLLLTFWTCLSIPMPVLERPAAFEWYTRKTFRDVGIVKIVLTASSQRRSVDFPVVPAAYKLDICVFRAVRCSNAVDLT